jgi:D-xylose transport system ATP-binding protein
MEGQMADNVTPSDGEVTPPVPEQPSGDEATLIMPERQLQSYEEPTPNAEAMVGAPEQSSTRQALLLMRGINKSFGAVRALTNVDFEVYAGEVVGLVGDNGAGKSTLIKTIAGVGPADDGEIFVEGQSVKITTPQVAARLGIETVYQDLALCDNLDVVANLFLGREDISPIRSLKENEMERKGLAVLHTLEVKIPSVRTVVASLSGGQRQSIAVAKSLLRNAKVVLLDEPTAALGVAQTRQVLNLIRRLRDQGLAVVVISHNLADVFEVVDRVIVLRLGRRVGTFDVKSTTPEQVVSAITGAEFGQLTATNGATNGTSGGNEQ